MNHSRMISVVIRTLNEERHLADLLAGIRAQRGIPTPVEIVLVDSGSTDRTLEIAADYECRIVHIGRAEFTFGRSLNKGCEVATGEVLVFVSGHCIPTGPHWLRELIDPLLQGTVAYTYGCQLPGASSRFSEGQLFAKYFPGESAVPQDGFFCNNANAAMLKATWAGNPFDEDLTGLEDMELARRLVASGKSLGYVASAGVLHLHDETWRQVRRRYEREAIALQHIMPQVHISFTDMVRYVASAVVLDSVTALRSGRLLRTLWEIVMFRCCQYWGSYRGNNDHRLLSRQAKEVYFFPR
jgi:rhamnosyltransferase